MLKQVRQKIVQNLWETYSANSWQIQHIANKLKHRGADELTLDHFAIIDLPGPHSGIPRLQQIFSKLGFSAEGKDYLAEKQNDFMWLTEEDSRSQLATDVLPQVVIADFRLEEMPPEIRQIIEKYSHQTCSKIVDKILYLIEQVLSGNSLAESQLISTACQYFAGRDWPLPTLQEFRSVQQFNELLAWVLVFGRRPNHFTVSVHLLNSFANLEEFHRYMSEEAGLVLNQEGGLIKGGPHVGIAQGSTVGDLQKIALADAEIDLPDYFVEFVWRFPAHADIMQPVMWGDYFTGFIAQHADRVIESLYTSDIPTDNLLSA